MPTMLQLERKIEKLQRQMVQVRELLGLYPPLVDPLKWNLKPLDKRVLTFLIKQPPGTKSTTSQIATTLGLENPSKTGRICVWRSFKRIQRMSKRKRKKIVDVDRTRKTYAMNRADFMYPGDLRSHLM